MFLALLLDTGVLFASLLSCGMATCIWWHGGFELDTRLGFWQTVAVMTNLSLVTAAAHLTRITLWAVVFIPCHGG